MKQLSVILLILFFLTGCSLFGPVKVDPGKNYELNTIPVVPKKHRSGATFVVGEPEAEPVYNSTQIPYIIKPYEISYFAINHWAAPPAAMLQNLMVQTLQNTQHFRAVVPSPFVGQYTYLLTSHLLRLEQNFLSRPSFVCISMDFELIRASTGRVIATKEITAKEFTPQNTPYGGVIAANRATAKILRELARFILDNT